MGSDLEYNRVLNFSMHLTTIYPLGDDHPVIGEGCFIAPTATVIGRVSMGKNSSLWFHSVARGDVNSITIGENSNIQDLCMLHVDAQNPLIIEAGVSVGHNVVLHGCRIGAGTLVGMGAIVMDGVEVGTNCLIAAGALLPPGKKYPAGSLIKGSPARAERSLTVEELNRYGNHYKSYLKYKDQYLNDKSFQKTL